MKAKIFYVSSVCDDELFSRLHHTFHGVGFAVQKYHKLMIRGLAKQNLYAIYALSSVPTERLGSIIEKHKNFHSENYSIRYFFTSSIPIIRHLLSFLGTFLTIFFASSGSVVVSDVLKISSSFAALLAAKLRGFTLVGIVTDLPKDIASIKKTKLAFGISSYVLNNQDKYVLLSERMTERINIKNKPYIVAEGQADGDFVIKRDNNCKNTETKVCLYAGSLDRRYGINHLIESFLCICKDNEELHIYGAGDMATELREISNNNPQIKYFGVVDNESVIQTEMCATLLINPRGSDLEFTKYSFPSKTMEYMTTGTPVLMAKLPSVPDEYDEHLYYFDDQDVNGLASALRKILDYPRSALQEKGEKARHYVLTYKNHYVVAKRLISLIDNDITAS